MDKKTIKILILVILLHVAFFGAIWYFAVHRKHKTTNNPPPSYVGVKPNPEDCVHPDGIDLSHHNVAYDWSRVDAKFVYGRATMGCNIVDKRYDIHRKAAGRHDIPFGAYHFLTAKTSAKRQFEHFASVVDKSHLQLRPMLDVEEGPSWNAPKGFSDIDAHNLIREWCTLCKKHYGKAPIIYTTEKLYQRYKLHQDFDDCIWWVANYNNITNFENKCIIPYVIHQYSDTNYVEGFYGKIDCNRFRTNKSVNDLKI